MHRPCHGLVRLISSVLEEKAWKGGESFYRGGDKRLTCGARIESALSACLKNRFASTGDSPGTCLAVLRGGVPVCCRRLAGGSPGGSPALLIPLLGGFIYSEVTASWRGRGRCRLEF